MKKVMKTAGELRSEYIRLHEKWVNTPYIHKDSINEYRKDKSRMAELKEELRELEESCRVA